MVRVILTPEQAELIRQAQGPVELCDPAGSVVAAVEPELSAAEIAELKRKAAAGGPRYTGQQVQQHLQALEAAWHREDGFDKQRLHELLNDLRAE